jgi:hypothetical protein
MERLQHAVILVECMGSLGILEKCTLKLSEFVIWVWQLVIVKYSALKYLNKVTILTLCVYRYDIARGPRFPALQVNSIVSENYGISPETDYCTFSGWEKNLTPSICKSFHHQPNRTECPTRYRTRNFFNKSNNKEEIATNFDQEYVRCVRN